MRRTRRTLRAAVCEQVERAPGRPGLAFVDLDGRFTWLSRQEVYERAVSHGTALADRRLRPGDVCILALPSTEFCASLLLGALLLGAVPLLVAPPVLPGREAFLIALLRYLVRQTRARLVVVPAMSSFPAHLMPGSKSTTVVRDGDLSALSAHGLPANEPADRSPALLQLTSGTTGFPRICVWTHAAVTAALTGMSAAMRLGQDDRCLNWTPLYHDMGLANNFLLCLVRGIPLALMSPTDFVRRPSLWLRALADTRATVTWSPNFGFALAARRIRDTEVAGVRLDHVRAFWNAAERVHLDTLEAFHRRFGPLGVRLEALKTNYGCAENVGGATFSDCAGTFAVERVDAELLQAKGIARVLPDSIHGRRSMSVVGVGRACPGVRVRILSRTGRHLPDGQVGEVALHTPSRMTGYLGRARDTGRALRRGLLLTGDLGYLRGGELFWVGRLHERITIRGRKLDPSDFERVLLTVPGLRHGCFVAFGVADPRLGTERLVVAVEVGDATADPDQLSATVRGEVHAQLGLTIDELLLVEPGTLTKTSSGKRRHRVFRRLYLSGALRPAVGPGAASAEERAP